MNVYVRSLGSALARAGVAVDVLTRAEHPEQPPSWRSSPGSGCCTCRRGRARRSRCATLPDLVGAFTDAAHARARARRRLRRAARELLGVGRGRPPAQARARPAAGHHVPHARTGEGRSRSGPTPSRCGRASRPRSCAAPTSSSRRPTRSTTSSCATTAPTPTASRSSRPASTTTCSRPATAPRRVGTLGLSERARAAVRRSHPAAQGRRPRGARARGGRRPRARSWSSSAGRAVPTAPAEVAAAATRSSPSSASSTACASSSRSRTTSSPTTTAPPTCASCRRAPSRSGSSRSRPRRAARRSSPPTSAVCGCLVDDGVTGYLVDDRDPAAYAAIIDRVLRDGGDADARAGRRAFDAVPLEHRRGSAAPSLRRPHGARATVKCS